MKKDETIDSKVDKAAKTTPHGMAPDKAPAGLKLRGTEPEVETEETFDNSPNNANSVGNRRLK